MRPEARLRRIVRRIEGWWYGTSLFTSHQKVMQLRVYCLLAGGHRWTNFTGPLADAFPDFCAKCVEDRPSPTRPETTAGRHPPR